MNLAQIKSAIQEGKTVYCGTTYYKVIKDSKGQYMIQGANGHCIGLTWTDEVTLNGKEDQFFTDEPLEKSLLQWEPIHVDSSGNKLTSSIKGGFSIFDSGGDSVCLVDFENEDLFDGKYKTIEQAKRGAETECLKYASCKQFLMVDKSGREGSSIIELADVVLMTMDGNFEEYEEDGEEGLHDFATNAEVGDTWSNYNLSFTCTELF